MSQVMTGAKAIFRIKGVKIAWASNVSYNENYQLEPVNVLDQLEVNEHADRRHRHFHFSSVRSQSRKELRFTF